MPLRRRFLLALTVALSLAGGAALAQPVVPVQAILPPDPGLRVLDQDRLFTGSRLGQALLADLNAAERRLDRENQTLAEQLEAEERALTELRATLPPEEFRERAEAFDRRVDTIRAERARLSQELARRYETEAQRFFEYAVPILSELLAEEGISVLLRPEAMILGADWLDITDLAIERIDAAGDP